MDETDASGQQRSPAADRIHPTSVLSKADIPVESTVRFARSISLWTQTNQKTDLDSDDRSGPVPDNGLLSLAGWPWEPGRSASSHRFRAGKAEAEIEQSDPDWWRVDSPRVRVDADRVIGWFGRVRGRWDSMINRVWRGKRDLREWMGVERVGCVEDGWIVVWIGDQGKGE